MIMQMLQEQTSNFLDCFDGDYQFFAFPDKAETGYFGTLGKNISGLLRDNKAGKDIYFTVNGTKPGIKRTKDKYTHTRAVHIDDDGDDKHGGRTNPEDFPLQPNIIVHTSPGKYHYYWLTSTDDGDTTEQVLRGMAVKYNGDPKTTDRTRIMRLPGFVHNGSGVQVRYEVLSATPYPWSDILAAFPPQLTAPAAKNKEVAQFSVADAIDDILNGEDVHGSRIRLAMRWANTGMPKADALATLNSYVEDAMRSGAVDPLRAYQRLGNMAQAVESAYAKVEAEQDIPKYVEPYHKLQYTKVPKATGNLGLIVDDVNQYMRYPSYEMATVVAMHCISVFGGGLYHLRGRTVARKRTILALTGRGKSIANKYFSEVSRKMALKKDKGMFDPYPFTGGSHYAVNNIHLELAEHRVRSFITAEAGLMGKSTAGTTHESRAYLLNLIAADFTEGFSGRQLSARSAENRKLNEQLKPIYAAIPVLLSESVPEHYIDVLNSESAFTSGDVGREELLFIDPRKPEVDEDDELPQISTKIVGMLYKLAKQFHDTNTESGLNPENPDSFKAVSTAKVKEQLKEHRLASVRRENEAAENNNYIEHALATRLHEKVLTTCLVQAIIDYPDDPHVTPEHLQYAIEYQESIITALISQSGGQGALADPLDKCVDKVIQAAQSFGTRKKDRDFSHDFDNKIISREWITMILDKTKFKPMRDLLNQYHNNRNNVFRDIISILEDKRLLKSIPSIKKSKPLWKINT
jgi:hypothetical protein